MRYKATMYNMLTSALDQMFNFMTDVGANSNLFLVGQQWGLDVLVNHKRKSSTDSPYFLATTIEAILGAVYLDSGMTAVHQVMRNLGMMPHSTCGIGLWGDRQTLVPSANTSGQAEPDIALTSHRTLLMNLKETSEQLRALIISMFMSQTAHHDTPPSDYMELSRDALISSKELDKLLRIELKCSTTRCTCLSALKITETICSGRELRSLILSVQDHWLLRSGESRKGLQQALLETIQSCNFLRIWYASDLQHDS